ncbi:hypothetical protein CEXT_685891 [Caerostris extrusa]|uniref:Uncharacterized protein n=1 Tax=Caerostris extrusa TaxID=172846 RepID=A0AAV4Q3C5_CAEEX|nr:hypothetical protein CEXT_685891 [Caerostris extrusa]
MEVNFSAENKNSFPQISINEAAGVPELTSRENLEGQKEEVYSPSVAPDKVNYFFAELCESHELVKVKVNHLRKSDIFHGSSYNYDVFCNGHYNSGEFKNDHYLSNVFYYDYYKFNVLNNGLYNFMDALPNVQDLVRERSCFTTLLR